jgi:hypothetical protein
MIDKTAPIIFFVSYFYLKNNELMNNNRIMDAIFVIV